MPSVLTSPLLYTTASKIPGAVFRIRDDLRAPKAIRNRTIQRELTQLGIAVGLTAAVDFIFVKGLKNLFNKFNKVDAPLMMILRAAATLGALSLAEITSRRVAPKPSWQQQAKASAKDPVTDRQPRNNTEPQGATALPNAKNPFIITWAPTLPTSSQAVAASDSFFLPMPHLIKREQADFASASTAASKTVPMQESFR